MMDNSGSDQRTNSLPRTILIGAGLGAIAVLYNTLWTRLGDKAPIDVRDKIADTSVGALAGAIIALVLYFTRSFRERGRLQHYLSWMLAGFVAAFVLIVPAFFTEGWRSLGLFFLLGCGTGLGLGLFDRQVKGFRW